MEVLIAEDDVRLAQALGAILEENDYQVDLVHDGQSALDYGESGIYDVIILDVMMPKMNGFEVVTKLRRKGISCPVLMLTARAEIPDKIRGFDSGADDYMTKPFSPSELLAHLRALLRRQGEVHFETTQVGNLELDLENQDLNCNGKTVHLSHKEFQLARLLMTNHDQILPKDSIRNKIWGIDSQAEDNNVEAYVSFLRKKFRFVGANVQIEALRKLGYRLSVKDEE